MIIYCLKQPDLQVLSYETFVKTDPGPIASMFWLDDSLGASIYLDGIITVVDALNINRSLDHHDNIQHNLSTAHLQISHADILLLNKIDIVEEAAKITVSDRIRSINSLAKIYETSYSRVPSLDEILDLHAYDGADFPIDGFNRDTSGHLDHVYVIILHSNYSLFQLCLLIYQPYLMNNGRN